MSNRTVELLATPRQWLLAGVVASFYPLLGLKRAFATIGAILAVWGLVLVVRRGRRLLDNPAMRVALLIAACFWLPMVTALPDALYPAHSAKEALKSLLYLPMLVAVIYLVQEQRIARPFLWLAVVTAVFWAIDALVQQVLGRDIFGQEIWADLGRVGAYWFSPAKFGYYMGYFGLFALAALATVLPARPVLLSAVWLLIASAVLVSGNREAWLMFFPFSGLLFWVHIVRFRSHRSLWLVAAALMVGLLMLAAWEFSQTFQSRVLHSIDGLAWSYEAIDRASSHRLGLWQAAVELFAANWLNGMGLDGFKLLFPDYTRDPYWVAAAVEMYPHQYILEILVSTGLIGLAGLLLAIAVVVSAWRRATPAARCLAWPALIYLAAMWFPFNTHRSFYASELMMGNWIMLGLMLGSLLPKQGVSTCHDVHAADRPSS